MRKKLLIVTILIGFMLHGLGQNTITLSFTGQDANGEFVRLDSVMVKNVTQGWSETLIYPDTSITFNDLDGVDTYPENASIHVIPNPLRGNAQVLFRTACNSSIVIQITDMNGKIYSSYSGKMISGDHLFNITLEIPQIYVLTIITSKGSRSVKLINTENGGSNHISYIGSTDAEYSGEKTKGILSHDAQTGDFLEYKGYAQINGIQHNVSTDGQLPTDDTLILLTFLYTDSVPCPGLGTLTDYDGNVYNTVMIGNRCWMKENLRTRHYANGTEIPLGTEANGSAAFRYYPDNDSTLVPTLGYLYNWSAFINGVTPDSTGTADVQGVCPAGWHIPRVSEWNQLINHVKGQPSYLCGGGSNNIAKALASKSGWDYSSGNCTVGHNPEDNNATGFNAVPAGGHYTYDTQSGRFANFWMYGAGGDNLFELLYDDHEIWKDIASTSAALSVRCVYGQGISQVPPTVTTAELDVNGLTVVTGGTVVHDGGADVISRGVCWSTSPQPTLSDNHTSDGSGIGTFISSINSGLTAGETYYVRAYATNSAGTSYGNERTFQTFIVPAGDAQPCAGATTVTDYDGNVYHTVQIGNQCWMKENLRTTHYSNGTSIALGQTTNPDTAFYYVPQQYSSQPTKFGYLYNWSAVMNGAMSSYANPSGVQGICPTGWHVPSSAEWNQLIEYLWYQPTYTCNSDWENIAKSLASTSGWHNWWWTCVVGNQPENNNATGFSAYPAGGMLGGNTLLNFSDCTYFWTSSETNSSFANTSILYFNATYVDQSEYEKLCGLSVRCVHN